MFKKIITGITTVALVMTGLAMPITNIRVDAAVNSANGTSDWSLVWSDEFEGTSVNANNWSFEIGTGDNGWGNNEAQYYTDRADNAYVSDGSLHIIAKRESYGGRQFTSARIKTQNKQYFQYGRIESRIKFTNCMQDGLWPAFWMLGNNISSVGWPSCGELDIMEHANSNQNIGGTFHWRNGNNSHQYSGGSSSWGSFGDNRWHVFAVEWFEDCIKWYIDNEHYYTLSITDSNIEEAHTQQFILLNFAIGSTSTGYTGNKTAPASFTSAEMEVDYVRVYQGSDSAFLYNNQSGMGGVSADGWTKNGTWSVFQGSAIGWTTGAATMTGGQNIDNFAVNIINSGAATTDGMWSIQAKASDVSVTPNVTNRMTFDITSDKAKTIWVLAENNDETKYLIPTAINLSPGTNSYSYEFIPAQENVNIIFAMGYDTTDVAVASSAANISVNNFKIGRVVDMPGTVDVDSCVARSSAITFTTENGVTYAGNLNNGSYLDYFVKVPEAGDYTINLKLAAGDAQWNADNFIVKINNSTVATIPVQASSSWTTFVDHNETINFPSAGAYTISLVANGGACNVTDFSLERVAEEPETLVKLKINGYQVSTISQGFRTIYTVEDEENEVVSSGLVYGLNDVSDSDMVIGSANNAVYTYQSTSIGKYDTPLGSSLSESYVMTMKFVKTEEFYNAKMSVRAYAELSDGRYVYSDVVSFTVFSLAEYMYQNRLMNNYAGHNYLYTDILTVVNPSYKVKEYNWSDTVVKMGDL